MSTRVALAVALSALVLLAGAGPVGGAHDAADRVGDGPIHRTGEVPAQAGGATAQNGDAVAQYKVSLDNVTIRTWLLRNATVLNATVGQVVVQNATAPDGARTNVTLSNVTVGQFDLERARMKNVTATRLVVRNKSVLSVPGGGVIDPDIENRTIDRHWTKNATVSGVVIDKVTVDAAALCGNATLGPETDDPASFDPTTGETKPDVSVQNGTVGEALIIKGEANNWSVGSVDRSAPTNASLPKGCSRG